MPKTDVSLKRSVAIQLYLKEGIADEDLLLRVWNLAQQKGKARGQNLFRMMLTAGLLSLTENGQMPEEIVETLNLDMLVDKKIRRKRRIEEARSPQPQTPTHPPAGFGYPQPYPQPYPAQFPQHPYPAQPYYPAHAPSSPQPQQSGQLDTSPATHEQTPQKVTAQDARPVTASQKPDPGFEEDKQVRTDKVAADKTPVDNENSETKGSDTQSFLDLM